MALLVFVEKRNARIDYIFDLMLGSLAGLDFVITENPNDFKQSSDPKFSYSSFPLEDEVHIHASGLLAEVGIYKQEITFINHNGIACPFAIQDTSDFVFDLFSAGFYLVTRYEEYISPLRDLHGRFRATDSVAFKNNFLDRPVINVWSLELRDKLKQAFPSLSYRKTNYQIISTIDIDQAYAYKYRGVYRTIGRLLKNICSFNIKEILSAVKVWTGIDKDPFDTFDFIAESKKQYQYPLVFFIHLGNYGQYDKSIEWNHSSMHSLADKIKIVSSVGLHPSYASNTNAQLLKEEIERFQVVFDFHPIINRQHYLKLTIPDTYRSLIKEGFTQDYTMGYADQIGFRASISTPFLFFDLEREAVTDLTIYPFAIMDRTLKDQMKLSVEEAKKRIKGIKQVVKESEGVLITLWHNESLSDQGEWKGWRAVYTSNFELV